MRLPIHLQRQQIILIVGVVLAILAIFMIKVYLDQQNIAAQQAAKKRFELLQASQTAVLVAKVDIPRGATIESGQFETKIVPNQFVQPGAVTSLDRIADMVTIAPIAKGEQIVYSKLSRVRTGDLEAATPVNKRAITISVDNVSSLAGMIKPGNHVDVVTVVPVPVTTPDGKTSAQIATFTLFQNVLILAVGQETSETAKTRREGAASPVAPLITLALSPQEANIIAFIQEQQGRFRLVLRSPADAKVEPVQPVDWPTVLQYLMPQSVKSKEEAPKPVGYVEIYRGLNKEKVPIYK